MRSPHRRYPSSRRQRRELRKKILDDAGELGLPDTYRCEVWVGVARIDQAAAALRDFRAQCDPATTAADGLELAVDLAMQLGGDSDPPVLMLGLVDVTANPLTGRPSVWTFVK